MTSKLTNSEIGSSHWLNTLLGNILHVGEYMLDHDRLTPEQMKEYGQTCYHGSREILDWFGIHPIEILENEERFLLIKLKEKYEKE